MRTGNCVVTPAKKRKEQKKSNNLKLKRKLVKKVFATRQLNTRKKVNVFRMARKLNPSAKVEYRNINTCILYSI